MKTVGVHDSIKSVRSPDSCCVPLVEGEEDNGARRPLLEKKRG
jgi:hypothetical protein